MLKLFINKFKWVVTGNIIFFILTLYLVSLLSNYFEVYQFGLYNLFLTICSIGVLFVFSPIFSSYRPYYLNKKSEGILQNFENELFHLILFPTAVFLLIFLLLFLFDNKNSIIFKGLLIILYSGTTSLSTFLDTIALTKQKEKFFYLFMNINIFLRVCVILYLEFIYQQYDVNTIVSIFILINIITLIVQLYFFKTKNIFKYKKVELCSIKSCFLEIFFYSKNFFLLGFISWWRVFYDKILIKYYLNSNLLGLYTFYFQYSFSPFQILTQMLSNWVNVDFWSIRDNSKKQLNYVSKHILFSLRINIIFTIIIVFLPNVIINYFILLVANSSYLEYSGIIKYIALGGLFFSTSQYLANFLVTKGLIKTYNIINVFSFLFSMILLFVLITHFQLKGVAIGLLIINLMNYLLYSITLMLKNNA